MRTVLTDAEIRKINYLDVSNSNIKSLRGIKYFTALKVLRIYYNEIEEAEMEHVVRELPKTTNADIYVYVLTTGEKNYMNSYQVNALKGRGWTPYYIGSGDQVLPMMNLSPTIVVSAVTAANFPDANFRKALQDAGIGFGYETTMPYITKEDVFSTLQFFISNKSITSLKGIEYFTYLMELYCRNNQLTELDVSKNTKLRTLSCENNHITGANMDALIAGLPINTTNENHRFVPIQLGNNEEGNTCYQYQVAAAKARGWETYISYEDRWFIFEGMPDPQVDGIAIDSENFPDSNFRSFLLSQAYGKDGILSEAEIASITRLDLGALGIKSLRGIKFFTALKTLYIQRNNINENEMEHLVRELPEQSGGTLYAFYFAASDEQNYMNYLQMNAAQAKGWSVMMLQYMGNNVYSLSMLQYPPTIVAAYVLPEYFPDPNFRNALQEEGIGNFYFKGLPYITYEDVANTKIIKVEGKGIATLNGIQFFTALEELYCGNNQLNALILSNNKELHVLDCKRNKIKDANMDNLITSLPERKNIEEQVFTVMSTCPDEGNTCTKQQVATSKARGWKPLYYDCTDHRNKPYEGFSEQPGDVNGDGNVNSADVQKVYALMADGSYVDHPEGDVNGDGYVNSADVQKTYSIMAGNK